MRSGSSVAVDSTPAVALRAAPAPRRRPRILVAEDDAEMRRILVEVLRKEQYEVTEARDGFAVLDHVATSLIVGGDLDVDLVVSDVRMPGANGLQILSGLRTHDPNLPVILITAFGNAETHAEARRRRALAVIDKPFDVGDLLALIRQALPPGRTTGEATP